MVQVNKTQFREPADRLNRECFCLTLDRSALHQSLLAEFDSTGSTAILSPQHEHLFSDAPVFVPREDVAAMQEGVGAIEAASALPGYSQAALSWAPDIAGFEPGTVGAFMGYDFHLGQDGPRLIEINTNAGGAFLNAHLARAQLACCGQARKAPATAKELAGFESRVVAMFEREWQRQRGSGRPGVIAIVDTDPQTQYLYLEFKLARRALEAHGIAAVIVDPAELSYSAGRLMAGGHPVDLVYNRLVDFALESPAHEALRQAYLDGTVVVTPNPRGHALFADKRNLTLLSDAARLSSWGLDKAQVDSLEKAVPNTWLVTAENADELWQNRRALFFKPVAGHGSKGVYRGSKLTRGVFSNIIRGGYIAQAFVPPGERVLRIDEEPVELKVDVRLYTYAGETLLTAARVYQGQATNFRTPGGGFAPVFQI